MTTVETDPRSLMAFIDAAPTPFHCCAEAGRRLEAAGFSRVEEGAELPAGRGFYLVRGGSLVAWLAPARLAVERPSYRLVGAHTDSPNLRVKPHPDGGRAGLAQLGVEVYGGALLNSWLDRDLGLAGRVALRGAERPGGELQLFELRRPLLRIPQLAIHLDREVNERGLVLNRQQHLAPFWASEARGERGLAPVLAEHLGVAPDDVLAWDAMVFPVEEARLVGLADEFVSAPRIDNQLSCWAGVEALVARAADGPRDDGVELLVLFDHEEVGSASDRGADGAFLASVLERVASACGLDRVGHLRALADSTCVSADGAHATNPNYVDRHEPGHQVQLNGGPVLKVNSNLRYATDARTAAVFAEACERADVPLQRFVNRSDLACGSTIGPLTASALALPTVDVGAPQLAMHSARELCGAEDPGMLARALHAYWAA